MMPRRDGFTLIEVLAVMALTGLVLGLALDYYMDLSYASQRATERTREIRQATAVLDRVARDLESAMLIAKPEELDPLLHPWLFLGESHYSDTGADHVKFVTRNHRARSNQSHESDLAVVSYTVRRNDDDRLELLRTSIPRLPESLDREFPLYDSDDLTPLLLDGLASFGILFLSEGGDWISEWDSSQLAQSGELPRAVEIQLALAPEVDDDGFDSLDEEEPTVYRRRVLLPVRPRQLADLLDPTRAGGTGAGQTDEDDEDAENGENGDQVACGLTVISCLEGARYLAEFPNAAVETGSFIQANGTRDFGEFSRQRIASLGIDANTVPRNCRECW